MALVRYPVVELVFFTADGDGRAHRWPRQIMTNKSISRLAWTLGLPGLALATGHPVYIAVSGYPELGMLDWMIAIVTEAILVSFLILVCWHSILNARNGKRDGLG